MLIALQTFDGHALNSSDYRSVLLNPHGSTSAAPVYLPETEADAMDADTYTVNTQAKVLAIEVRNYGNRVALINQLKQWFKRGTRASLVATFNDDGLDYQLDCRVVSLMQEQGYALRFLATLNTGETSWRAVEAETETWSVTGSGGSHTLTVGGYDDTRLILSLTASASPSSGYSKQNLYQFANVPGVNFGYRPWCLTINTQALVAAGKMQADCADLRLFNGEIELKRWIVDPNTTTTKVFFNLAMNEGFALPLKSAVLSAANPASVQFTTDATTRALIAKMATTGLIVHGTEWIYYSGKRLQPCRLNVGKRGVWGTTRQSHAAGDVFYYIQNPLRVVYGNPAATDPSADDDTYDNEKPVLNMDDSNNLTWVWDATSLFYDTANQARTAQWKKTEKKLGTVSKVYHTSEDVEDADPAIGLKAGAWQKNSLWKTDTVELAMQMYCPVGFTTITTTGQKFRSSTDWFPVVGLQRSNNGLVWRDLWSEATPSAEDTWEPWSTHSAVAIPAAAKYVRLVVSGIMPNTANSYAMTEALTLTLNFQSGSMPSGSFLGETENYPMDLDVALDLSGDSVSLSYPANYDTPFLLDSENSIVTYDDANAHRAVTMEDAGRSIYLRLQPGDNALTITAADDLGTVDVSASFYRRRP